MENTEKESKIETYDLKPLLTSNESDNNSDSENVIDKTDKFDNEEKSSLYDTTKITEDDLKPIKERSPAWSFFKKIDHASASCNFCDLTIKTSGNTTNISNHLKKIHFIDVTKIQNVNQTGNLPEKGKKNNIPKKNKRLGSYMKIKPFCDTWNDKKIKKHKVQVSPTKKPKRTPSAVWKYFNKTDKFTANCILCDITMKTYGNTTNLRYHLMKVHPQALKNSPNHKAPHKIKYMSSSSEEPYSASEDEWSPTKDKKKNFFFQNTVNSSDDETEEENTQLQKTIDLVSETESENSANDKKKSVPKIETEVWKYFEKEDNNYINCNLCDKIFKFNGNTIKLQKHLERMHDLKFKTHTANNMMRANDALSEVRGYFVKTGKSFVICKICNCQLRIIKNSSNLHEHLKNMHYVKNYPPTESIITALRRAYLKFKQKKIKFITNKYKKLRCKIQKFYQIIPGNSNTCKLCGKNLVTKRLTNLANHLKNKHSDILLKNLNRNYTRIELRNFCKNTENFSSTFFKAPKNQMYSASLGPNKSFIWNYFIENDDSSATCIHCEKILRKKDTANLLGHIKNKHSSNEMSSICDLEMKQMEKLHLEIAQQIANNADLRDQKQNRNKTSDIWHYFIKNDISSAICKLCEKTVKTSGNTSNLRLHFRKLHNYVNQKVGVVTNDTKKGSKVWFYFDRVSPNSATCKMCDKTMKASSTTNLNSHLIHKHDVNINEMPPDIPIKKEKEIKREKSNVWKYFTKNDDMTATCNICNKTMKTYGNTSNLRQHIEVSHFQNMVFLSDSNKVKKEKKTKSSKPTRGKSKVWNYFEKDNDFSATCIICGKTVKTSGNTSNLRNHIKHKHSSFMPSIQEDDSEETPPNSTKTSDAANKSNDCTSDIESSHENDTSMETAVENCTPEKTSKKESIDIAPLVFTSEVAEIEFENAPFDNQIVIENQVLDNSRIPVKKRTIITDNVVIEDNTNMLSSLPYIEETEISTTPDLMQEQKDLKQNPEPKKKKCKSNVWDYFHEINADYAMCKFCEKTLKSCGNTTNLRNHISQVHHLNIDNASNDCSNMVLQKAQNVRKHNQPIVFKMTNSPIKQEGLRVNREKSDIWQLFEKVDHFSATCKCCFKTVKTCGNTTNLRQHILRKHRNMIDDPQYTPPNPTVKNKEFKDFKNKTTMTRVADNSNSVIWNYFDMLEGRTVICRFCDKKLKAYRSTANLFKHMEKVHGQKIVDEPNYATNDDADSSQPENGNKIALGQQGEERVVKLDIGEIYYVIEEPNNAVSK